MTPRLSGLFILLQVGYGVSLYFTSPLRGATMPALNVRTLLLPLHQVKRI
ncbi:hypothetical protein CISECK367B_13965 [Citrobacter sedlakii]